LLIARAHWLTTGNPVANQFIIHDDDGNTWFQSYRTTIAKVERDGTIVLDVDATEYSRTTSKYLVRFLESFTQHRGLNTDSVRKLIKHNAIVQLELN
jgi:hypothetical protein